MILPNFRFRCVFPRVSPVPGAQAVGACTFALRPTALPKPTAEHAVCIPSLFYPLIRLQENDL
jgi:hypothetical protein